MSKYFRSGQLDLTKLTIVTNSKTPVELDMSRTFVDVTLYESITEPCMSGSLSFVDTNNIITLFGLGNGEIVNLEFCTAGASEKIKFSGVVYDITGPAVLNDHASGYTLHYVSPFALSAMRLKLFNAHSGTPSDAVNAIFKKLSLEKRLELEKTKFLENIVFTGDTASEGITMMSKLSISADNNYGYMFYEDNEKFNFKPITSLYSQEPVRDFKFASAPVYENPKNAHEEMFDVYQDIEFEDVSKHIDKISDGQYGSTTISFSLMDKKCNTYTVDHNKLFNKNKSLAQTPFRLEIEPKHTDKIMISNNIKEMSSEPDLDKNRLSLLKAVEVAINIGVFGDSTLKVGEVVLAAIPSYSSKDFAPDSTDVVSGKFLVADIKHILTPKQYNQRLLLIKDGYEESLG